MRVTHRGEAAGVDLSQAATCWALVYTGHSFPSRHRLLFREAKHRSPPKGCTPASRTAWSELLPPPGPVLPQRPAHLSFHGHEGTSRGTGPLASRAHTRLHVLRPHCWDVTQGVGQTPLQQPGPLEVLLENTRKPHPHPHFPRGSPPRSPEPPGRPPSRAHSSCRAHSSLGTSGESPKATDRCL